MRVLINGRVIIEDDPYLMPIEPEASQEPEQVQELILADARTTLDVVRAHFGKHWRKYLAAGNVALVLLAPHTALAAPAGLGGGGNLILLIQKASFWVGMGVTMWGVVEAQLDYPGWRGRVTKGVLGYIAILLIPLVFLELRNSLQADVWTQIQP